MSDYEGGLAWRISSRCTPGTCVEVAMGAASVFVRNSRNLAQEPLEFDFDEWAAFVEGVRDHEFDAPVPDRGALA